MVNLSKKDFSLSIGSKNVSEQEDRSEIDWIQKEASSSVFRMDRTYMLQYMPVMSVLIRLFYFIFGS